MSKTATDLAVQLKEFYKTGHKYANYILLVVLTYIKWLCKELKCPLLLALH